MAETHESFPQKEQLYLECCVTSIFLITLRSVAPYRVPYLPQIPTFFVCLPISESSPEVGPRGARLGPSPSVVCQEEEGVWRTIAAEDGTRRSSRLGLPVPSP